MKRNALILLAAMFFSAVPVRAQESMNSVIERGLSRAESQALLMAEKLKDQPDALPRTFEKGKLVTCKFNNWVSGFFPGVLWMLYETGGDENHRR